MVRRRQRIRCKCTGPGWCERHQVTKSEHYVNLCRTDIRYWNLWEAGRGPGQGIRAYGETVFIWDCPLCGTRHGLNGKHERVCMCGTVRHIDGTVDVATSMEQVQDVSPKRYSHSATGIVLRWGKAIGRWVMNGRPIRTPEQVAEAWAQCETCQHLSATKDFCTVCDCRVSLTGAPLFNKLAMGTEACPVGKWKATIEVTRDPDAKPSNCGGCGGKDAAAGAVAKTGKRGK